MATLAIVEPAKAVASPPGAGSIVCGAFQACASGGDEFPNDGKTVLAFINVHASATRTVTVAPVTLATVPFVTTKTWAFVVPAMGATVDPSELLFTRTFEPSVYNNASGRVAMTYSDSAADLSVRCISASGN